MKNTDVRLAMHLIVVHLIVVILCMTIIVSLRQNNCMLEKSLRYALFDYTLPLIEKDYRKKYADDLRNNPDDSELFRLSLQRSEVHPWALRYIAAGGMAIWILSLFYSILAVIMILISFSMYIIFKKWIKTK